MKPYLLGNFGREAREKGGGSTFAKKETEGNMHFYTSINEIIFTTGTCFYFGQIEKQITVKPVLRDNPIMSIKIWSLKTGNLF